MRWGNISSQLSQLDRWINEKVGLLVWYNKMLIIGFVYFMCATFKYIIINWRSITPP